LACGAKRFVFPWSPLPEVVVSFELPGTKSSKRLARSVWVMAFVALFAIAAIGVWVLIRNGRPAALEQSLSETERLEKHLGDGRAAVAEGAWHRAAHELEAAIQLAQHMPTADRKRLVQEQREAAILADLLSESPAEIARQSLGLPEREWREVFRERFAGRSLILDDTIHCDASGHFQQGLIIRLHHVEMKYDLASVKLLRHLPLNRPQRVIAGFRLAGIRKDAAAWSILLDPDGGVLMTDEAMLSRLSVPVDNALREILNRQQSWSANLP
jgi:hypothetical protein